VFLELGVEPFLKPGNFALDLAENVFQIAFEFDAQTLFQFFTVHNDNPP
jgi:hypothetical protein